MRTYSSSAKSACERPAACKFVHGDRVTEHLVRKTEPNRVDEVDRT